MNTLTIAIMITTMLASSRQQSASASCTQETVRSYSAPDFCAKCLYCLTDGVVSVDCSPCALYVYGEGRSTAVQVSTHTGDDGWQQIEFTTDARGDQAYWCTSCLVGDSISTIDCQACSYIVTLGNSPDQVTEVVANPGTATTAVEEFV